MKSIEPAQVRPPRGAALAAALLVIIGAAVTAAGRSVAELAEVIGIEYRELRMVLDGRGQLTAEHILVLADELGVRPSVWLDEAERMAWSAVDAARAVGAEVWFVPAGRGGPARVGTVLEVIAGTGSVKLREQSGRIAWAHPGGVLELVAMELPTEATGRADARGACAAAVADGRACCVCGHIWAIGQASRPAAVSGVGTQLFRCAPRCEVVAGG